MTSEAVMRVVCDHCGGENSLPLVQLGPNTWGSRDIPHLLTKAGWIIEGAEPVRHFCSEECGADYDYAVGT